MKAAETLLVANAAVRGITDVNLPTFLTGNIGRFQRNGKNNSWIDTTQPVNAAMGGTGGVAGSTVTKEKEALQVPSSVTSRQMELIRQYR